MFSKGTRVKTPGGEGVVVYARMAAPNYDTVASYSVRLYDHAARNPWYTGSIYPANEVIEIK